MKSLIPFLAIDVCILSCSKVEKENPILKNNSTIEESIAELIILSKSTTENILSTNSDPDTEDITTYLNNNQSIKNDIEDLIDEIKGYNDPNVEDKILEVLAEMAEARIQDYHDREEEAAGFTSSEGEVEGRSLGDCSEAAESAESFKQLAYGAAILMSFASPPGLIASTLAFLGACAGIEYSFCVCLQATYPGYTC